MATSTKVNQLDKRFVNIKGAIDDSCQKQLDILKPIADNVIKVKTAPKVEMVKKSVTNYFKGFKD